VVGASLLFLASVFKKKRLATHSFSGNQETCASQSAALRALREKRRRTAKQTGLVALRGNADTSHCAGGVSASGTRKQVFTYLADVVKRGEEKV